MFDLGEKIAVLGGITSEALNKERFIIRPALKIPLPSAIAENFAIYPMPEK